MAVLQLRDEYIAQFPNIEAQTLRKPGGRRSRGHTLVSFRSLSQEYGCHVDGNPQDSLLKDV